MAKVLQPKKTQGHIKMLRYIEDLIRNKEFKKLLKRLKKLENKQKILTGNYYEWPKEEQVKHDYINNELSSIINGYEILRKRTKKLFRNQTFVLREKIATYYDLDNELIDIALERLKNVEFNIEYHDEPDMCRVISEADDQLNPQNRAEEILYLNPDKQIFLTAFPASLAINTKASKRDVLDFIEKRWNLIEQAISGFDEKRVLKNRKRKHGQNLLDFIWEHHSLTAKQIKKKLDVKFPKNGLVYFEINKLVNLEKKRRNRDLTLTSET